MVSVTIRIKNCSRIALRRFPANEELFANRLAEIPGERGIMIGGLERGVGQEENKKMITNLLKTYFSRLDVEYLLIGLGSFRMTIS